jgi:transcription elongation factor GreA
MPDSDWLHEWDALIDGGDGAAIEEFWLKRLEGGVEDAGAMLEALRRLRSASKKTLAAMLLELAADQSHSDGAWAARRDFLRELIRLGIGDQAGHRAGLEECVRHLWSGSPSLGRLIGHFKVRDARKPIEALEALEAWLEFDVGNVFLMVGKGPGRVVEANPQLGMLRLDLEREKRVPVPIDAARKYLTPLPPGHFLRRRLEEPQSLAAEVVGDPPRALEAVLESFAEPMAVPAIRSALQGLVGDEQWTSWWNRARKNPRVLASGSGTRVQYRLAAGGGAEDEIREEFLRVPLASRLELGRRHAGRGRELVSWMARQLVEGAGSAAANPAEAWDALALALRLGADAGDVDQVRHQLLERAGARDLLAACSDASQREAILELLPETRPDEWRAVFAEWFPSETHPRLQSLLAEKLVQAGEHARVSSLLDQVLLHAQRHASAFVWVCELAEDGPLGALIAERRGGAILVRLVELAEKKEFAPFRPRLRDVLSARGLAATIVQERITADQARRLLQILENPGELAEERAWLRRALHARFPELHVAPDVHVVPALAATVERLQEELRALREREIPEVLRAIQVAKEHGDLRENFEYHSARARQEFLSARAAKLQEDLAVVRVIDPATVDTSQVRVGTCVRLESQGGPAARELTILGPYEADPERGIISSGTEVAQTVLGREVGDEVELDGQKWKVASIRAAV